MAAGYFRLFNFAILQRYRWRALDFQDMQDNGIVAMVRAALEGAYNGAVLRGLDCASATGLNFTVNPGLAVGPTGNVMCVTGSVTATFPSPTGAAGCRHLVVVRPYIVTQASAIITPPTLPLTTAPLNFDHQAQVLVLDGSALSGAYPATGANDVILFGVHLDQNAVSFTIGNLALQDTRDYPGRRNTYSSGHVERNTMAWDDRCRVYNNGAPSVGIKPSQTARGLLTFNNANTASIFPKSGGSYNGDAGDTFLNFKTGAVSGSDATSSAFVPTIPAIGTYIWALITLSSSDTLAVTYGTAGTYAQCRSALKNQTTGGAGGIPSSSSYKLAYVLLGSNDGVNITELDVFDARATFAFAPASTTVGVGGGGSSSQNANFNVSSNSGGIIYEVDTTSGAVTASLPNPALNATLVFSIVDKTGNFGTNACTLHRFGTEKIINLASDYVMNSPYGVWNFFTDGTNWYRL